MYYLGNFDQKIAFFRRALPLKVSVAWRRAPLENFTVSQPKMDISNSTKGDPSGRQGVESLREKASAPTPPPPKSATAQHPRYLIFDVKFVVVVCTSKYKRK